MKPKLAIVGTGIAGMGAAHFLQHKYDLTIFERNNYVGGHTNTVTVDEDGTPVPVDTGFIVFNHQTYPHLTQLFKDLGVETKKCDMSFGVQHKPSGLEYCGSGLDGLFAQRKNFFKPSFVKMLMQINRFNKEAANDLASGSIRGKSMLGYCAEKGFGEDFLYKYLAPMSSALWSTPTDITLKFPAESLVRFFQNHGLLGLNTQYQWYTVHNGSWQYRDKLIAPFKERIKTNEPVLSVKANESGATITTEKGEYTFDKVILASHANESLKMLESPTALQQELLTPFEYQHNRATLHTDDGVMPKIKKTWSAWNYLIMEKDNELVTTTIYSMNHLQQVSKKKNYYVSINDPGLIDRSKILKEIDYEHPIFTVDALNAQHRLQELNEEGPIYFTGSYFRYGFHEDALASSVKLCEKL